jgi:hypothetical protein
MKRDWKTPVGTVASCGLKFSQEVPPEQAVYRLNGHHSMNTPIYFVETRPGVVLVGEQTRPDSKIHLGWVSLTMAQLDSRLEDMERVYPLYDPALLDEEIREVLGNAYPVRESFVRVAVSVQTKPIVQVTFLQETWGLLAKGYPLTVKNKNGQMHVYLDATRVKSRIYEGSSVLEALQAYLDHTKQ